MAKVTIEGSGSWVGLARGERRTVALTSRIQKLIAKGFVVEVERFKEDGTTAVAAVVEAKPPPTEMSPQDVEELKQAHTAAVADPVVPAADETVDEPEHSPYASGGLVGGPTTMPSSLEQ